MIAGRDSQIWPSEHAKAAIAANPFGHAVIIEDSGHSVSFDQPDRFNDLLLEFLRTQGETLDR
jgi:pimeloyl-ACP methyl ester carboxylesterase